MKNVVLAIVLLILAALPARASYVVQNCGQLPLAYAAGATRDDVVDVNGNKCVNSALQTQNGWTLTGFPGLTATIVSIKNSAPGQLGFMDCGVATPANVFVQLFDVATPGVASLGTTAPKASLPIAAGATSQFSLSLQGLQFANGIQAAATTTATGSSAPANSISCAFGSN